MLRFALGLIVLVGATGTAHPQDRPERRIPRHVFEKFRKMSPEQREQLRRRVEEFRKLPAEERERLLQNWKKFKDLPADKQKALRERFEKLGSDEVRRRAEMARRLSQQVPEHFPRGAFFKWLQETHPGRFEELKKARDPQAYQRLAEDFREHHFDQLKGKKGIPPGDIEALNKLPLREYWKGCHALQERLMKQRAQQNPGPRPRPRETR